MRAEDKKRTWKPASIQVYAGEGRVPLEIMPLLKDPSDDEGLLRSHTKRLEFPPDVYPPHWDLDGQKDAGRKKLIKAIVQAAAKADIALILGATFRERSTPAFSVICAQGRTYRPKPGKSDVSKSVFAEVAHGETKVKENIQNNRMVNQKKRPTLKVPLKDTCRFQIYIHLDEGKCWYIKDWNGFAWHNHQCLGKDAQRHRMKVLSQEEATSAVMARHGGIAAAKAVQKETSDFQFSAAQMRYNKDEHGILQGIRLPRLSNENGQAVHISDAEDFQRHLEVERERGRPSYAMLKHEIKDSTLHTICKNNHKRMEAAAKPSESVSVPTYLAIDSDHNNTTNDMNKKRTLAELLNSTEFYAFLRSRGFQVDDQGQVFR